MSTEHTSARAPIPVGPYPHARQAGNLLFLSGIGPREPGTNAIPGGVEKDAAGRIVRYDFEAQCRSVFRNIRIVLEDAGARWEDVVDVTAFLIDLARDFDTFNRIYAEHFTTQRPTRTTVEVSRLPTPIAIELKIVASIERGGS